jgi:NADPH:quinone reductase-like Zn-dependent oxidoreductase
MARDALATYFKSKHLHEHSRRRPDYQPGSDFCASGKSLPGQLKFVNPLEKAVSESILPSSMTAVLLTGHGDLDRLEYRQHVPVPHPQPDEVLVRVSAAAINNTDINLRTGWYSPGAGTTDAPGAVHPQMRGPDSGWSGRAVAFPLIQGADACGYVVAVGGDVDTALCGQRVLVDPVLRSRPTMWGLETLYLGSDCNGAFAEYLVVPAINAHPIKTSLSDVELACIPCSFSAAENMLERAAVRAGDTVLVTGASGGVGSAAVQLARRRSARVVALAGADKAARVSQLGAAIVLSRDADLLETLGHDTVDVVIDVVGGPGFPVLLNVLRRGGRYAVAGAIGGAKVVLDLRTLYLKDLRLLGCTLTDVSVFANLVRYLEAGEVSPVVAQTYPLSAIAQAQREFLEKQHTGKLVLVASGS